MSGTLQDNYSPNWVPYFSLEGDLHPDVNLSVECGICRTELAIINQADQYHEPFTVLPCGHAFGHKCIIEWFSRTPSCPICRRTFRHRACGHPTPLHEIQGGRAFNIHRDLPPAIHPDEELPDSCATCQPSTRTNRLQYRDRLERPRSLEDESIEDELLQAAVRLSLQDLASRSRTQSIPDNVPPRGSREESHSHGLQYETTSIIRNQTYAAMPRHINAPSRLHSAHPRNTHTYTNRPVSTAESLHHFIMWPG
ncbi:hypothetical protein GGR58DRAFT_522108 [Xylaria digitata]|nr:hypothetical protein GGR58DRAFT_522108 [Xylaria digitata]